MARWLVETRATVIRHYYVEAANQYEAEAKTSSAKIDHEEDENEETLSINRAAE